MQAEVQNEMSEYKFHPDIAKLPIKEIDTTYTKEDRAGYVGFASKFFEVPTEMVLTRAPERELWKHCPSMVNYDILQCIEEICAAGLFPYNSSVEAAFCKKFNTPALGDGTFLSAIIYCTQSYRHTLQDEIHARQLHEQMIKDGFVATTEELLKEVAGTKRKFLLHAEFRNMLSGDVTRKVDTVYYTLKDFGTQGMYWMKPRARNTGYRAKLRQYVKELK